MRKYAKQCSITGEGMNEGYVYYDGEMYFKYEKDFVMFLKYQNEPIEDIWDLSDEFILNESYDNGEYYWTEWEDENEYEYYEDENGKIFEI
jgi:hypothetical protein